MASSGMNQFSENLRELLRNLRNSIVRHERPVSDRSRSQVVFSNLFLHIHATRTHMRSLAFRTTMGLGVSAFSCFIILTVTGILLMVYYMPSIDLAYNSIKDIHYVVPSGRLVRNIHRWCAHMMVAVVLLHMCRVFYAGAYKAPREFNWVLGMILLVVTLALSFTGYLLPWDQLAYWAITIGANIAAVAAGADGRTRYNRMVRSRGLAEGTSAGRRRGRTGSPDPLLPAARDRPTGHRAGAGGRCALLEDPERRRFEPARST